MCVIDFASAFIEHSSSSLSSANPRTIGVVSQRDTPPPLPPRHRENESLVATLHSVRQPQTQHQQLRPQEHHQTEEAMDNEAKTEIFRMFLGSNPFKSEEYPTVEMTQTNQGFMFKCIPCCYDVQVVANLIDNNRLEFNFSWETEDKVTLESMKSIQLPVLVTKDQFEVRKNVVYCNFVASQK
jgi:hypothetical protein